MSNFSHVPVLLQETIRGLVPEPGRGIHRWDAWRWRPYSRSARSRRTACAWHRPRSRSPGGSTRTLRPTTRHTGTWQFPRYWNAGPCTWVRAMSRACCWTSASHRTNSTPLNVDSRSVLTRNSICGWTRQPGLPQQIWSIRCPKQDLADVIYRYGEERASRRIARYIVERRQTTPIHDNTGASEHRATGSGRQKRANSSRNTHLSGATHRRQRRARRTGNRVTGSDRRCSVRAVGLR